MERSSRVLQHGNPKMWFFFFFKLEIDEIEFCPYPEFPYAEKKNRPGFVNTSPTLVIDTSTERSSRVLQHGNQKLDFFQESSKLNLTCAEEVSPICRHSSRSHLYVDIEDASSSLWGSTSSFSYEISFFFFFFLGGGRRMDRGSMLTIFRNYRNFVTVAMYTEGYRVNLVRGSIWYFWQHNILTF